MNSYTRKQSSCEFCGPLFLTILLCTFMWMLLCTLNYLIIALQSCVLIEKFTYYKIFHWGQLLVPEIHSRPLTYSSTTERRTSIHVKNSQHFVQILKFVKTGSEDYFVSFNVESSSVWNLNNKDESFLHIIDLRANTIMELLDYCVKNCYFEEIDFKKMTF